MNEYRLVGFRRERWKALFFRWRNSTRARSYSGTRISHDGSETLTLGETAIKETEGKGRRGGSRERRFSRYARSYLMYLYRSGYI
ncbi:hypothetical protein NC653_026161 [Populus alba x Populus x berolinensis]|uniref:Uncharacterized protein n=1 Tax=Populus alba x Populus x berolinensis TaxID=444605 RepID=A0AAD6MDB5_9ROSI|nr:hypothetical protein NC653_026161 [Populus alba x Populus x berolinensis]